MQIADGKITEYHDGYTVENTLFTYSEEEKQANEINRMNAELILKPKFIPVNPQLLQDGLSPIEAMVYGFIDFFLSSNEKFYCTNEQLSKMLNTSEKTISMAVNKLKDVGLINISYKIRSGGGKTRYIHLADITKSNVATLQNVISDITKSNVATLQKHTNIENKVIENNIIYSVSEFSDIYNMYYGKSKGINETVCNKLIQSKLKQCTLDDIKIAVVLYNAECKVKGGTNRRYVKKFETWIKEFQPLNDDEVDSRLRIIVKMHGERIQRGEKYTTGNPWLELCNVFGEERMNELRSQESPQKQSKVRSLDDILHFS